MSAFVLVPGAWLGGWCWRRVTPVLRAAGHEVYTPTLTGLGERAHLGSPETDLDTHILDVVNLLEWEELRGVVLVGHSYAGLVIGGAADRVPERLAHLVFLAANLPRDGHALFDEWSPAGRTLVEEEARVGGDGWRWPFPDDLGGGGAGLAAADERWLRAKAVGHPLRTFAQPLRYANPSTAALPRTYIRCAADGSPLPDEVKRDGSGDGWRLRQLPTGHYPMISRPRELAEQLLEVAAPSASAGQP